MKKLIAILSAIALAVYFSNCLKDNSVPGPTAAAGVYLAGAEGGGLSATYWKNGVAVTLDGGNVGTPTSIAVSGNDVYVASCENWYWKNGVAVGLNSAGSASSIFVAK